MLFSYVSVSQTEIFVVAFFSDRMYCLIEVIIQISLYDALCRRYKYSVHCSETRMDQIYDFVWSSMSSRSSSIRMITASFSLCYSNIRVSHKYVQPVRFLRNKGFKICHIIFSRTLQLHCKIRLLSLYVVYRLSVCLSVCL